MPTTPAVIAPPTQVVLLENIHAAGRNALAGEGFDVTAHDRGLDPTELRDALAAAQIVGIRSKTQLTESLLDAAPELMAIGCFCIGTNQVDLDAARRRGVVVFNAPFSNTRSVAELTLAEIIALHRRLAEKSGQLHAGHWDKSATDCHEVRGRTLGIIGYGHIGTQLSILAEAVGMRVLYHDIQSRLPLGNATPRATLNDLLEESDVVSLHVPATPLTDRMIGATELARMRRGAFLINNARGSVVDLDALRDALERGHLGGAAVDVFPSEPAANGEGFRCPLAGCPNVILTPHVGGSTEEAQDNIANEVSAKLIRFVVNGSTASAVNVPQVDLPNVRPAQHRILHFHHNVPGVLSKMHRLLADLGVNINAEHLESDPDLSYVMLDVDADHAEAVRAGLAQIPETIRVRTLCDR